LLRDSLRQSGVLSHDINRKSFVTAQVPLWRAQVPLWRAQVGRANQASGRVSQIRRRFFGTSPPTGLICAAYLGSYKASSFGWLSADRSGGVLTHRLNRRLRSLRIRKITPTLDRPHSVTFPTHRGEPLTPRQPTSGQSERANGGRSANSEPMRDEATVPGLLPLLRGHGQGNRISK
jgi:hypothetical protein